MFLAVFFALVLTSNVPNPRRYTLFSFASEPLTASVKPSTTVQAVVASIPVLFDTSFTISAFLIIVIIYLNAKILCLIQKTKQPQWNFVSSAEFDIVDCKIAVRDILDLNERLVRSTNFDDDVVVYLEVSVLRVLYFRCSADLIVKEGLSDRADLRIPIEGIHKIRIVKEHLLRCSHLFYRFDFGLEKP